MLYKYDIGFMYDVAYHCIGCTEKRFPDHEGIDTYGEEVTSITSQDEFDFPISCDDCFEYIEGQGYLRCGQCEEWYYECTCRNCMEPDCTSETKDPDRSAYKVANLIASVRDGNTILKEDEQGWYIPDTNVEWATLDEALKQELLIFSPYTKKLSLSANTGQYIMFDRVVPFIEDEYKAADDKTTVKVNVRE